eukprot:CAMPEP_0184678666 /NCGR_PEP_ID=MMETSP0312-20130426/1449_1 /TAXON_ID=31354 /ORGANISM="Compsopogon coeruleus, Strain SAG 36.94" /LENGTH=46 /DNA_ID= /DNA_START= /DNA_END= /DNA_ORIENTATION=
MDPNQNDRHPDEIPGRKRSLTPPILVECNADEQLTTPGHDDDHGPT